MRWAVDELEAKDQNLTARDRGVLSPSRIAPTAATAHGPSGAFRGLSAGPVGGDGSPVALGPSAL
ncbi:hypothetical protein ACWD0Z_07655 [Streptomyces sp. NPDC003007]